MSTKLEGGGGGEDLSGRQLKKELYFLFRLSLAIETKIIYRNMNTNQKT